MMISGSQLMIASDFFHLKTLIKQANLNAYEKARIHNAEDRWEENINNGRAPIQSEQSYQSRACELIKCAICCPCISLVLCYKIHEHLQTYVPAVQSELNNILEERAALMQPVPSNDIEMADRV